MSSCCFSSARILELEQQLLEKDTELVALQEAVRLSQEPGSGEAASCDSQQETQGHQGRDASTPPPEDAQEDETTLVAEDTSVLSLSADNESSSELIGHQSESPEESKGTSSDEMVASSDSEVAHSSWTLLEALNQDGGQEWPSMLQDFGQLQLQSWEATSMETETSTVQVESSSVIIRETVQVHVTQQGSSSTDDDVSSGQVFAQVLAEELQKRYSELLAELQRLREAAAGSQEKIQALEADTQSLAAAKAEAESQARCFGEELHAAREELEKLSQQSSSTVEKHGFETKLLEEQIDELNARAKTSEEKIEELQTALQTTSQAFSEQEGRVRMLGVQLEDRELLCSELERKLEDLENSMLECSQTSELNKDCLTLKDTEISQLQLRLSQKEQEVAELNDSMSAKLLQAEEEKSLIDSEVSKLKEQIVELEKVREEEETASRGHSAAPVEEEVAGLRQEKEVLETQLVNTKKKLQAALVQRKELMKKVAALEAEAQNAREQVEATKEEAPAQILEGGGVQEMEGKLIQLEQALRSKEEEVGTLQCKMKQQDEALTEALARCETAESSRQPDVAPEAALLQSQVTSLEAECETLQKKVQEAQESRKETIRKAQEKDRHHREQLRQQKEEYSELMERFEVQSGEREDLLSKVRELEEKVSSEREDVAQQETRLPAESVEKQAAGDWVQEDWVDFAASETESTQPQPSDPVQPAAEPSDVLSAQTEEALNALREEVETLRAANAELERRLQDTQAGLSLKEAEVQDVSGELQALREKASQIDALSEEMNELREKHHQAESYAETLKAEMEAAAQAATADSIATLQAEVEDFKQFLDNKNHEISELSQQLTEQTSLIHLMQDAVSQKDQLVSSLQAELKAEQEKSQRLEVEGSQKLEDDRDGEAKIQQLQRRLQAALISRKEALKENKTQKEQLASSETLIAELQQKVGSAEDELEKLRAERVHLIDEVDRTLLENQSLGSSCESLKLAMEGILNEKDACKREAEFAKEEATRRCKEWEDKVQGMKEEYETLLTSYENVSDEAERVRRVLEAARQERQELAARVRTHEVARQEAERQAEEAQKEVDSVKDKMRKFAKTKQQKIMDLEEENERLREIQEKTGGKRDNEAEVERLQGELQALKAQLDAAVEERDSLGQQIEELRGKLTQTGEREDGVVPAALLGSAAVVEDVITAQQSEVSRAEPAESQAEDRMEAPADRTAAVEAPQTHVKPDEEAAVGAERELWQQQEADLKAQLASLQKDLQESKDRESLEASLEKSLQDSKEREQSLMEEGSKREAQFKELLRSLESEKDNLEERLMNQLAQLNGSIAGYQQEAADNREHLADLQRQVERLERERAELEAQARSEGDRAARLEEDMRQAQRERAEAEAGSGKQRELEQQLRSAQRVKEGSQSRARQLEELLREKQLEVRQLQNDCIQYQERISDLGREAKALQLGHDELRSQLEKSQMKTSTSAEELKRTEAELASCKSQLEEAQRQVKEAVAEKTTLEQSVQQREAALKEEAEQTLDSVRFRLGAELKEMELRLEDAYNDRDKEEEATVEAREIAERAEARAQEVQARLDESLARLAAFSRCMSSLQDDRDRVLDEARQWETRFKDALQGKEAEVREAETRVKELAEQLQRESALKEELQLSVDR